MLERAREKVSGQQTLHLTAYTLHPTHHTLHPEPHTLHSTTYTLSAIAPVGGPPQAPCNAPAFERSWCEGGRE